VHTTDGDNPNVGGIVTAPPEPFRQACRMG
jgi:hypothetical protein